MALFSQTFEIDQIEQLFRPRLKMDARYLFNSRFQDTSNSFQAQDLNTVFTFPIKSKLDAELKLDLSSFKLRDIIKNSVRLKASQTLGMFRANLRQANVGFDSLPTKTLLTLAGGVLGAWLTRKYHVAFYNFNIAIAEQDKTIGKSVPRFTGLLGRLHIRGFKRHFFYGLGFTYSDGLVLPAPFFGGSEPIGKKIIFNYTLPVQVNVQYKDDKRTLITCGISADGYRTGILYNRKRVNVNYTVVLAYANLRYKLSKTLVMRLEGGYVLYQNWRYTPLDAVRTRFNLAPGPYAQVGFNVLFGKTIWEKLGNAILSHS